MKLVVPGVNLIIACIHLVFGIYLSGCYSSTLEADCNA